MNTMSQQTIRLLAARAPSAEAFSALAANGTLAATAPSYRIRHDLWGDKLGALDGKTGAALWSRGKCSIETAVFVATLCCDAELLVEMLKRDKRVRLTEALVSNPHLPLNTLLDYAEGRRRSWAQERAVTSATCARLARVHPRDALRLLRDRLPDSVYGFVAERSDLTADVVEPYLTARYRDAYGNDVHLNKLLAKSPAVTGWPPRHIVKMLRADHGIFAAIELAKHDEIVATPELVSEIIETLHQPAGGSTQADLATLLAMSSALSPAAAFRLYLTAQGPSGDLRSYSRAHSALAGRTITDPRWWGEAPLHSPYGATAAGRLLAAAPSLQDPQTYASAVSLAPDWNGTVKGYVQACLMLFGSAEDDPFTDTPLTAVVDTPVAELDPFAASAATDVSADNGEDHPIGYEPVDDVPIDQLALFAT